MSKSTTSSVLSNIKSFTTKHSPEILMGIGIAGMITTTILAVKATPKALALVEDEKLRRYKETEDDTLTKIEIVKTCWKCYVPAVVTGAVSTACLIGSRSVSSRRTAALAAAYQISETALSEYREKVIETIGEKKEKTVRDKVAEEKVKQNPVNPSEIVITAKGNTLCLDPISGRYFKSDQEKIKRAENELNKRMLHDISGYASLNELYDELGLPHIDIGGDLGWNTDNLIDISFSAQLTPEGEPAIVIDYLVSPKYNYDM